MIEFHQLMAASDMTKGAAADSPSQITVEATSFTDSQGHQSLSHIATIWSSDWLG